MFKMADRRVKAINLGASYSVHDLKRRGYIFNLDADGTVDIVRRTGSHDRVTQVIREIRRGVMYSKEDDIFVFNRTSEGRLKAIIYVNRETGNWGSIK